MANLLASGCATALLLALGLGCATPTERADREAEALGLARDVVAGAPFAHVIYRPRELPPAPHAGARSEADRLLHVYIGGDGSPRGALRWNPPDPTPSDSPMLRLMARDPEPRVYLGRPCYHGAGPCNPWLWTLGRYSDSVVSSMAAALERVRAPGQSLVLIGHSGGGTLAMLLAERVAGVRAVVTLSGNLDVAAWTKYHGFAPLDGSLDPSARPPLDPAIVQLHAAAGRDDVVPPGLVRAAAARQPGARVLEFPDLGHVGPWEDVWPALLDELARALAARGRRP